jgi:Sap, sulfolipid-1-addressing protein
VRTLILSVIGLGLGIAVTSPVSVVTVIVVLTMPAGRRRAVGFVAGWLAAIAVIAAFSVFVLHGQDFSSHNTTPSRTASALEIVIGSIVLVASARAFRRHAQHIASAETPKWVERLDRTNWLLAILVGSFMLTYSLTLAAALEILKAHVSTADTAVAFAVFALASIATIVAPIVLVFAAPDRAAAMLAAWRRWLLGNARAIGLVALMVIGVALIARGSHDLIA